MRDFGRHHSVRGEISRGSPIWMTVYADMMTNLTFLFLMLFVLTRLTPTEQQLFTTTMNRYLSKTDEISEFEREAEIITEISEKAKQKGIIVNVTEETLDLYLPSGVLFDSGSAELKPGSLTLLKDVAELIRDIPNKIIVEGHTDNIPISSAKYSSNWELSQARALSVVKHFTEKSIHSKLDFVSKNIEEYRLCIAGYGEYHPISSNDTAEGRAANRRIEIKILRRKATDKLRTHIRGITWSKWTKTIPDIWKPGELHKKF